MDKFGIQIERINKIQSPLPISIYGAALFCKKTSVGFNPGGNIGK